MGFQYYSGIQRQTRAFKAELGTSSVLPWYLELNLHPRHDLHVKFSRDSRSNMGFQNSAWEQEVNLGPQCTLKTLNLTWTPKFKFWESG